MFRSLIILLTATLFLSCSKSETTETTTVEANTNSILIDVRSADEFQTGHIENAINIPHSDISEKISQHEKNKDAKIVVYCKSGRRAGVALKALEDMGYKDVTNAGGYEELKTLKKE